MWSPPEISYGANYQKGLSTTEVAKRIRAQIRAAVKEGTLPQARYSVRTDYFSGGSAIRVRISDLPFPTHWEVPEHECSGWWFPGLVGHTPAAVEVERRVEGLVESFNYDGSDSMVDYFHVNFYSTVTIEQSGDVLRTEGAVSS